MTDRELLEAAARAAGLYLEWDGPPEKWIPMYYEGKTYHVWNPLADDGDALRLAVTLRIDFCISPNEATACAWCEAVNDFMEEPLMPDPYSATRRAIVRAAAAMAAQKEPTP